MSASADHTHLIRWATYASVGAASLLIIAKLVAWMMTGSVALLSTLVDSCLDAGASLLNLLAVRHALEPADHEHRYGHGKAEPLAGMGQAAFILGSGVLLCVQASNRLAEPQPVTHSEIGIGVMVFSILVTLALVRFQKYVLDHSRSVAISADSLHYTGDVLINGSVIISLGLGAWWSLPWLDPLFALGIALFLLWNAWAIARDSLNMLMDRELPDEDRKKIRAIALAHPDVKGMHDLRTRLSGQVGFIQMHLELDPAMTLGQAHQIADQVEEEIRAVFANFDVIIHQDPVGVREAHPPLPDE